MAMKQLGLTEDSILDDGLVITDIAWVMNDSFIIVTVKKGLMALVSRDGLFIKWNISENQPPLYMWHIENPLSFVDSKDKSSLWNRKSLYPSSFLVSPNVSNETHGLLAITNGFATIICSLPAFNDQISNSIREYYNEVEDRDKEKVSMTDGSWATTWVEPIWNLVPIEYSYFETRRVLFLCLWRHHLQSNGTTKDDSDLLYLIEFYCQAIWSKGQGKTGVNEDLVFGNHISMAKYFLWSFSTAVSTRAKNQPGSFQFKKDHLTEHTRFLKLLANEMALRFGRNVSSGYSYIFRIRMLLTIKVVLQGMWNSINLMDGGNFSSQSGNTISVAIDTVLLSVSRTQLHHILESVTAINNQKSKVNQLALEKKDLESKIWSHLFQHCKRDELFKFPPKPNADDVVSP